MHAPRRALVVGLLAAVAMVASVLVGSTAVQASPRIASEVQGPAALCHYVPGSVGTPASWVFVASIDTAGLRDHQGDVNDMVLPVGASVGDCGVPVVICANTPDDPRCQAPDGCPDLAGTQEPGTPCAVDATPATAAASGTAPADGPVSVSAPQAGTVVDETVVTIEPPTTTAGARPAAKPVAVAVPVRATVPTAVNAGGGSSAQGAPALAWLVLALGAIGVIGSTRVLRPRR